MIFSFIFKQIDKLADKFGWTTFLTVDMEKFLELLVYTVLAMFAITTGGVFSWVLLIVLAIETLSALKDNI